MKKLIYSLLLAAAGLVTACSDQDPEFVESLFFETDGDTPALPEKPNTPDEPSIGNLKVVDLGLSVKWVTTNLEASILNDPGLYYNYWAAIEASEKSGKNLRLPTANEVKELIKACDWAFVKQGGETVVKGTSPTTKGEIIIPMSGYYYGNDKKLYSATRYALFWTSDRKSDDRTRAYIFNCDYNDKNIIIDDAECDNHYLPVRLVYTGK